MAYNRHFISKRKNIKTFQTNTSAKVQTKLEEGDYESSTLVLPGKAVIEEARKTGELKLIDFGFYEIPDEIYFINRSDVRSRQFISYDDEEVNAISWWDDELLNKLDLSQNNIRCLSDKLNHLTNLSYLNLQSNFISEVPPELTLLKQLEYLNLSKNCLKKLPENLRMLEKLKEFNIANNKLNELPIDLCLLVALERLDISDNLLTTLPEDFGNFFHLKYLAVANNKISTLPISLTKLKELAYFDISSNKISQLPSGWNATFEILKVNINLLTNFPLSKYTPTLQQLHMGNNSLPSITSTHISLIPNISILNLSKNNIEELTNEIVNLHSLTHLDISFNNINSIPYGLGNMNTLHTLIVVGNPFRSINRTIMLAGTEKLKKFLRNRNNEESSLKPNEEKSCQPTQLRLVNPNQAILPQSLELDSYELNSAGLINISNRDLKSIPSQFFQSLKHKQVMTINMSNNFLNTFPIGISMFATTLYRLDVSFNKLMDIPDCFGNFKVLQQLNLSGNCLRQLPPSIAYLNSCLNQLDVSQNPIGTELPDCIFGLTNLQVLNASQCALSKLTPSSFQKLIHLNTLDLSFNHIEHIAPQFGFCTQIKNIYLDGNKLRHPLLSMLDYGAEAIFQYLRQQLSDPVESDKNIIKPSNTTT